jgi:DNA-binding MarR family transcriptional regulator
MPVAVACAEELIEDFLGTTHVFALALNSVLEQRLLRDAAEGQLTSPQIKFLRLVSQQDAQTVGDVAGLLGVSDAAASKLVDRLVKRGLVRRKESVADRRASELVLTDEGERLLTKYESERARSLEEIFREFPPEELRQAAGVLDRLVASIVQLSADPEKVCLQCGVYFKQRCLLKEVVRRDCQYRQKKKRQSPEADGGKP